MCHFQCAKIVIFWKLWAVTFSGSEALGREKLSSGRRKFQETSSQKAGVDTGSGRGHTADLNFLTLFILQKVSFFKSLAARLSRLKVIARTSDPNERHRYALQYGGKPTILKTNVEIFCYVQLRRAFSQKSPNGIP